MLPLDFSIFWSVIEMWQLAGWLHLCHLGCRFVSNVPLMGVGGPELPGGFASFLLVTKAAVSSSAGDLWRFIISKLKRNSIPDIWILSAIDAAGVARTHIELHICKETPLIKYSHIHTHSSHNPALQMSCGLKLQVPKRILGKTPNSAKVLAAKHKSAAGSVESRDDPCAAISAARCCFTLFIYCFSSLTGIPVEVSRCRAPVQRADQELEPASVLHSAESN